MTCPETRAQQQLMVIPANKQTGPVVVDRQGVWACTAEAYERAPGWALFWCSGAAQGDAKKSNSFCLQTASKGAPRQGSIYLQSMHNAYSSLRTWSTGRGMYILHTYIHTPSVKGSMIGIDSKTDRNNLQDLYRDWFVVFISYCIVPSYS
jgi:hypothetical protein